MNEKGVKRNYKDGVFRALFSDEEKLRVLYNALTGSNYPEGTEIEIITLENSIFGDIANDLAFIIDKKLIILIDHQSSVNPNMPLRMLCYIAKEYERYLTRGIYSTRLVKIPTPELYVFYNGKVDIPLEQELKLSDAFETECDKIALETVVRVININYEKGAEILKRCRDLEGYSRLIHGVRKHQDSGMDLHDAVTASVEECARMGILKEFLKREGGDIVGIIDCYLTREECEAIREEDGYAKGIEQGIEQGMKKGLEEGRLLTLASLVKDGVISIEDAAERGGLSVEEFKARLPQD